MIDSKALETQCLPENQESDMAEKRPAVAYLRTSSATNVGEDKDSHKRQLAAITAFSKRAGFTIVLPPYCDDAVSGSDPIDTRPGFRDLLGYLAEHSEVRVILVETASRFARDLAVQLTGHSLLKQRGIELIPVDAPDHFTDETPTATMVRQILGAVSQFEKASIVLKLRVARDRKRAANGKCEGRKSHKEKHPEVVKAAKSLLWANKRLQEKRSLREIAAELAKVGHVSESGNPYGPSAIQSMLAQ
jgi:DNA invertase Pin-like site-specific DNA recombinase